MIVDTRAGSRDLVEPLRSIGVVCETGILPSGDVQIIGSGPGGVPWYVGVEHKTITDLTQSIRDGRASEQLRAMVEYYQSIWLCVEGVWTTTQDGYLAVRKKSRLHEIPGRIGVREMTSWLLTETYKVGVLVHFTDDKHESAEWLKNLEMWWTLKDWEEHRSHLAVYTPEVVSNPFETVSHCHRAALAIAPRIGQMKAKRVAKHFKSVKRMVNATVEEWQEIEGVGKKIAEQVVRAMEEEE